MINEEDLRYLVDFPALLWKVVMELVGIIAGTTPEEFSAGTWDYVVNDLMRWTLTIGGSLFTTFYLINILRQTTNFRQGITLERFIEISISVIFCNYAMLHGTTLMSQLFKIAAVWSNSLMFSDGLNILQMDFDFGRILVMFFFSLPYFIIALVSSITILYVVYRRYLELYAIVAIGPIAWSTIPGGHGISNTFYAWLKGFLAKCFEIVIIVFFITIASKMCEAINLFTASGAGNLFDGAAQMIHNMLTMVLLAGSVGGAEMFIRRHLGLN